MNHRADKENRRQSEVLTGSPSFGSIGSSLPFDAACGAVETDGRKAGKGGKTREITTRWPAIILQPN